ncbi:hypothetical protein XENOCAPTIV_001865 [Xenoophorus captivus]|uniref:Uncharacterized protein n=1 Tax=Xenoophorus captivus TaxID=1517983 RepID=A0ABV0RPN8_9TELE
MLLIMNDVSVFFLVSSAVQTCYICEDHGRESKAACGACMTCNRQGCRQAFHVTCPYNVDLGLTNSGDGGFFSVCSAYNMAFCICGSLSATQDFHQFSSSSRLEREHDRGGDDHNGEKRKERHRRSAVHEKEEEEEEEEEKDDKDEEEEEEEEEEEDSKYKKPPALTPADCPLAASQSHERTESSSSPFENKVTISTFGSIMRITSSSGLGSTCKIRKISSSSEYKPSKSLSKPPQVTVPPVLEDAGLKDKITPPPLPRERRHHSNKKSRHGPGRPRGSKNRERREEDHHHHHHDSTAPPPPALNSSFYHIPSSVHSGSSTSYNLNSSQPFASCLSTASTLPPLLNQGQTSLSGDRKFI